MLDKHKFNTGMALMAGAFGREIDAPILRMYYGVLSKQLTDLQFERACALVLEQEKFWPSPAVIVEKVKPNAQGAAAHALEHVNRVLSRCGGHRFLTHETYHREFDAPTRAAIAAIGGLSELCSTPIERYGSLQKKFAAAYIQALDARPALPPAPAGKDLAAGVGD